MVERFWWVPCRSESVDGRTDTGSSKEFWYPPGRSDVRREQFALGTVLFSSVSFLDRLGFGAMSLLFVGLAVGVSAAVSTRDKSMAVVVMLAWLVVPVAIGSYWFNRADL
ncbi:hypothetical protein [Natrinema altunense]|uniref:hypothetical protein n=1 Tax=Natrinema altunense TaxID=222984 RepID=UPI001EF9D057|nr:hypothetical protein [Natrinema altunense]